MADQSMRFRVLGPLEIDSQGQPVRIDAPKQRAILAVLLIHANEVVSTDRLVDSVWGDRQPSGGTNTLRYHLSKLRKALPGDVIETRSPGYVLGVDPDALDALVFARLVAEARQVRPTDPSQAVRLLDEALGLWRGAPYSDFAYDDFAQEEIRSLTEARLAAMEDRFDALIALGRERDVINDLQGLVDEHPRRERLSGALMLALYRSGRQADALAVFRRLRKELGESLGIDPTQELQDLEEKILMQDPALRTAEPPTGDFLRGYVLRGRIGEGAHGVVWRAGQPGIGREVAIKAIRPELANQAEFVRRFEAEAQLVAALEHPHIVSLFDFWRDPEGAYLVMPYLRGGSLADRLNGSSLEVPKALALLQDIGSALTYAHRRGVVHRDVTPHNILLDDDNNPYLADFGVATLLGEAAAQYSKGTPSADYLSPELLAGKRGTPASDVFSLGVLTKAMLGDGGLSEPAVGVVARATEDSPEDRYPSINEYLGALADAVGGETVPAAGRVDLRNPYKGLRAFGEADAPDFFGRDRLVAELLEAVSRHRLVGVVGPSGCGKSSLVRAGLIPELRSAALPGSERWLISDMYPGSRPFAELEEALLQVAVDRPADLEARLSEGDWEGLVGELLPHDSELLLVIDQFEELFTVTNDEDERRRFLDVLVDLAADPRHRVRVVITMRADYYDRPLEYPEFAKLLGLGLIAVTAPGRDAMGEAVVGPAAAEGLVVDTGLAEAIVDDVAHQPGGLPLLEYALTELFRLREGNRLTTDGYHRTGGVLGALGMRAEELYQEQSTPGRLAIRQVFLRLVTVAAGVEDTRRRIPLTELQQLGVEGTVLDSVLDAYVKHRLLTLDRDPETRVPTVEVAHEALLARWDRLRAWIDERSDDLVLHRRLVASVGEWKESGREPGYLLTGGRLDHYEAFRDETDLAFAKDESIFLEESRRHVDELAAHRRRRRLGILAGFAVAAVIATMFALYAFAAQRRAEDAAALAEQHSELAETRANDLQKTTEELRAEQAETERLSAETRIRALTSWSASVRENDAELATLLALEAVGVEAEGDSRRSALNALHEAAISSRVRSRVPGYRRVGIDAAGENVVTIAEERGPVTVLDRASGETLSTIPAPMGTQYLAVAMSSDGSRVATGTEDGSVAVWDAASGEELASTSRRQEVWVDAESGAFTLTFRNEETREISPNTSAAELESMLESLASIREVTVSGTGSTDDPWIVTLDDVVPGNTELLVAGTEVLRPRGSQVQVTGEGHLTSECPYYAETQQSFICISEAAWVDRVVFSPDGSLLASSSIDQTIRLWNLDTFTAVVIESPLNALPTGGLAFSPDGRLLAAVSGSAGVRIESGIRVWNVETGDLVHNLVGSGTQPVDVEFLNQRALVVAHRSSPSLTVWNLATESERVVTSFDQALLDIEVSRSSDALATSDDEGTISVWELGGSGELRRLFTLASNRESRVSDMAIDESGHFLVGVSRDVAEVWDLSPSGSSEWSTFPSEQNWTTAVSFSNDGSRLAYGTPEGTAVVSDTASGEHFAELGGLITLPVGAYGPNPCARDLAFSPDGSQIATAGDATGAQHGYGGVKVWDTSTGELLSDLTLPGLRTSSDSVAYSPDGSLLAAVVGGEIRLWDARTFEQRWLRSRTTGSFVATEFSPDGKSLAGFGHGPGGASVSVFDLSGDLVDHCCEYSLAVGGSIDYSPDGEVLLTVGIDPGSLEGAADLWDVATGVVVATISGPDHVISSAIFSDDGELVATVGEDIRIWDVATLEHLLTLDHPAAGADLWGVDFSPDGTRLASWASVEGFVRVWALDVDDLVDIGSSRLTRTFTEGECETYAIYPCPAQPEPEN